MLLDPATAVLFWVTVLVVLVLAALGLGAVLAASDDDQDALDLAELRRRTHNERRHQANDRTDEQ